MSSANKRAKLCRLSVISFAYNINIRSARNKLDFLNNFTDGFDIIAVTETHLHPNISNNDIQIDSCSKHIIRKDRNKAGGGLLIYFRLYFSYP